jgi:hypothetical protein
MVLGFVTIAHIVAAVFAIIELGLTAYGESTNPGPFYSEQSLTCSQLPAPTMAGGGVPDLPMSSTL